MKKKETASASFAETVAQKAKARGWRGKPWPEGKPLPIEDVFAWLHIRRALGELLADPVVTANPAAVEFLQIVGELAVRGALSETAKEALLPIDGLMPMGAIGAKRVKQVSEFAIIGNKARIKYTKADEDRWRKLTAADPDLRRVFIKSKRRCAALIASREGLPPAAVETIRKAI